MKLHQEILKMVHAFPDEERKNRVRWLSDSVLILEQDKARLDWLEAAIRNQTHGEDIVFRLLMELTVSPSPVSLREVIDRARHAPQPKVTVIEEGK